MSRRRILAVDDDRHIVRLVEVNLKAAGYEVITAFDGVEALEKVKAESPDMVVLDVMMPRLDGFEVLKAMQIDPQYMNIPVIMLTAKAQDADIFKGWASGVSSYLTKPFNPRELLVFVERIFQAQDDEEKAGDWIDFASSGTRYNFDKG
jgi:two-component system alkaline phosphatase synthesis response regulator PhoP/two-component system response regulator VicR